MSVLTTVLFEKAGDFLTEVPSSHSTYFEKKKVPALQCFACIANGIQHSGRFVRRYLNRHALSDAGCSTGYSETLSSERANFDRDNDDFYISDCRELAVLPETQFEKRPLFLPLIWGRQEIFLPPA